MKDGRTLFVAYVGCPGFPYGLAAIQKMRLVARSLVEAGAHVTVISNRSVLPREMNPVLPASGIFEGIHYVYTSGDPRRPETFLRRTFRKIAGVWGEIRYIRSLSREDRLDAAIVVSLDFPWVLYYSILSRSYHFKIVYDYVEYVSGISTRQGWYYSINDRMIDRYALSLADGVLPISDFLADHVERTVPGKPMFRIPVLVDMRRFGEEPVRHRDNYFLYCGSLAYFEIVTFLLDAFRLLGRDNPGWELKLVVNGGAEQQRRLEEELARRGHPASVKTYSRLADEVLTAMLIDASALLIPLRPTLQDKARFPHKIGEYLATGCPVITTNYGEIPNYLADGESAVIASEYDVHQYRDKLLWTIQHPEEAKSIGIRGREVAGEHFDYRLYGNGLKEFILSLCDGQYTPVANRTGNNVRSGSEYPHRIAPKVRESTLHHETTDHVRHLRHPLP